MKKTVVIGVAVTGLAAAALVVNHSRTNTNAAQTAQATISIDTHVRNCQGGYYALTFDDGPSPMTQQYLDTLQTLNVKATFFVNGYRMKDFPGNVEKMTAAGHQVGNHTEDHDDLPPLDANTFNIQIDSLQSELAAVGVNATLFRPPSGATNGPIRQQIEAKGFLQTMWSVDTKDWEPTATVASNVAAAMTVQNGGIILMHENKPNTLAALPTIVNQLETTKGLCPGKIVKSNTELPTDKEGQTMNTVAVKP